MSERRQPSIQGMIFSTPMAKALWDGRKGQTRRLLPDGRQPRLQVGDRVYVRETFRISPDACEGWPHEAEPCPGWIDYAAGGSHYCFAPDYFAVLKAFGRIPVDWDALPQRWRPARHAPRWTSRMYLTITDVRVQQLQDIIEADARAEGVDRWKSACGSKWFRNYLDDEDAFEQDYSSLWVLGAHDLGPAKLSFSTLWNSLHTDPGTTWSDNPRIVAYNFTVTRRNIDVLPIPVTPPLADASPAARPSARDLIEGMVAPQLAGQLIRARDLPRPERKAS